MSYISEKLGLESISRTPAGGSLPFHVLENEELRLELPSIELILGSKIHEGKGVLFLTTRRLVWLSEESMEKGYGIDYPSIIVHAISTDPELHDGRPCVYLQLEALENEDIEAVMSLIPQDQFTMDEIFRVLSECSALNPDPEGDSDSELELGGYTEEQRQDLEELLGDNPERFQDPPEEDEENCSRSSKQKGN
eukprot:g827.t1